MEREESFMKILNRLCAVLVSFRALAKISHHILAENTSWTNRDLKTYVIGTLALTLTSILLKITTGDQSKSP